MLCSNSGCSYPLRESIQERDWRFHYYQKQDPCQAFDPTTFRQGAREKLCQSANIILHLGLHWTLFPGKLEINWKQSLNPHTFHYLLLD